MKQFCCGDVVPGCKAKFEAEHEDALFAQITAHANDDHGLREIPVALMRQVRAKVRDVNAVA